MSLTLFILSLAVFLVGFCAGIFAVLVISIHRAAKAPFLTSLHGRRAGVIGRLALTGIRDNAEDDQ